MNTENEPKLNIETIKEKLLGAVALSKTPLEAFVWVQAYAELTRTLLSPTVKTDWSQEYNHQVAEKKDEQMPPPFAEPPSAAGHHIPESTSSQLRHLLTLIDGLFVDIRSRTRNLAYAPNCLILFQAANAVYKAEEEALCADSPKRKS